MTIYRIKFIYILYFSVFHLFVVVCVLFSLIPELFKEFERVEVSSLQRSPQIVSLVQNTFNQLITKHGHNEQKQSGQTEKSSNRKDSEFVLQSDLQLVYVGNKTEKQRNGPGTGGSAEIETAMR